MKENTPLLSLACIGMELSWLYAWATFLTTLILRHPFPFPEAVGTFLLAAALTSVHHGRGWRVILVLCIQLLGFIPSLLRIVHVFDSWHGSFFSDAFSTYSIAIDNQGIPIEWLIVFLVMLWAFFFWGGGVRLAQRPRDYTATCSRFDVGIGAFLSLFLTKFYLTIIGVKAISDHTSEFLLFSFFIFGLLAIGLARNLGKDTREFMPGYRGIGVIVSFVILIALFGAGLLLFGLPYLAGAAKVGLSVLKTVSVPLFYILMKVINFIFGGEYEIYKPAPLPDKKMVEESPPDLSGSWLQILGTILMWVVIVLIALIFLAIIGATIFGLVKWLFSKTTVGEKKPSPWEHLPSWFVKLLLFMRYRLRAIARRITGYNKAVQLYAALLDWGRRSGLPHFVNETPTEYGLRLHYRFPLLKGEIKSITEAFNREVYGEMALHEEQLTAARLAFRKLSSPSIWPLRLKAWFRRSL